MYSYKTKTYISWLWTYLHAYRKDLPDFLFYTWHLNIREFIEPKSFELWVSFTYHFLNQFHETFWPWQVRRSVKVTCVFGVGITVRLSRACRLYRNTWWTSVTAKFSLRRCLPWNLLTFMITGERSADVYTVYLENICTSLIFAALAPHCQWPNLRLDKFYWIKMQTCLGII